MKKQDTDTLVGVERRLKPYSITASALLHLAGAAAVIAALRADLTPLTGALALLYLALTASNLRTFRGLGPSIGGVVVAIFALAPATLAGAIALPAGVARTSCLCAFVVSAAITCYFLSWFYRIRSVYRNAPEVAPDACLIVLGGLIRGGKPVPTLVARLHVAADLWRASNSRVVLVTGGPTLEEEDTEAEAMARWLVAEEGMQRDAVLLEPRALNTQQNLAYSAALLEERGLSDRQLCIVSSDYHLFRALTIAHGMGLDPVAVPAPTNRASRLQQWCREVLTILAKG